MTREEIGQADLSQRYFVATQEASRLIEADMVQAHQCFVLALVELPEAETAADQARHAVQIDIFRSRIIQLLYLGHEIPSAYDWLGDALAGATGPDDSARRVLEAMPGTMRALLFENAAAQLGVDDARGEIRGDCQRRVRALPEAQQAVFSEFELFVADQIDP